MLFLLLFLLTQYRPLDGVPVTQTPPATYSSSQTTFPAFIGVGCFQDGKWYPAGSENCTATSVTVSPTPAMTTTHISSTTHVGCFYDGKWYPAGSEISKGSYGNWCYGSYCTDDGHVVVWDNFNCAPFSSALATKTQTPTATYFLSQTSSLVSENFTATPFTVSPTPTITTTPISSTTHVGCFYDGKWYPAGSEISKGSDGKGWCYGSYCMADGQVVAWDNFNCHPSPVTNSAPAITTLASSLVLGYVLNFKLSE